MRAPSSPERNGTRACAYRLRDARPVVDPSAYTPPYDHALSAALGAAGADVELVTSRFAYGAVPAPDGYRRVEAFYRAARACPAKARRLNARGAR